jgi:hypothetical protein
MIILTQGVIMASKKTVIVFICQETGIDPEVIQYSLGEPASRYKSLVASCATQFNTIICFGTATEAFTLNNLIEALTTDDE